MSMGAKRESKQRWSRKVRETILSETNIAPLSVEQQEVVAEMLDKESPTYDAASATCQCLAPSSTIFNI